MADLKPLLDRPALTPRLAASLLAAFPQMGQDPPRFLQGARWTPWADRALSSMAATVCGELPNFTDPAYVCTTAIEQSPFQIYSALTARHTDTLPVDLEDELGERFALTLSAAIAVELQSGTASGGTGLADVAHAPSMRAFGSAAVTIAQGLGILEDDLARNLTGAQGTIHLSPGLLGPATQTYGLRFADGWRTPLGNRVVVDDGYVDMLEPNGQTASAAMKEWVYASGPINIWLNDPALIGDSIEQYSNMSKNEMRRWIEASGLLQFDRAPVTAVLVDY